VSNHSKRAQFVAAHPIAGTENSGPEAAFSGLFTDKTTIICEQQRSSAEALALVSKVFEALQMKTIYMQPDEHDRHVAYVSHLSHVKIGRASCRETVDTCVATGPHKYHNFATSTH